MNWDSTWEKVFKTQRWGKYPAESLIRFIARNFYDKNRGTIKILEVGCGTGASMWYVAREGFKAYGIDGSLTAINKAKEYLKQEGLRAQFVVADISSLPYPDNYFDAVIDVECIYANSRKATIGILKEINRVLKKDGCFYSRTFTDKMYIGKRQKKIARLEYDDISDGPLEAKGLTRLMDRKGILSLYGAIFNICSIDKLEYTDNNGQIRVSEWIIISKKKKIASI